MSLILHALPGSLRCSAVGMALDLAGVQYSLKVHSLQSVKSEEYKKLNPTQRAPAIQTDQGVLTESHALIRFAGLNNPSIYGGSDAFKRVEIDSWLDWINVNIKSINPLYLPQHWGHPLKGDQGDAGRIARGKAIIFESLKVVNSNLQGKKFLVGDSCSIADVALINAIIPYFTYIATEAERKKLKDLGKWLEGVSELAVFKKWFGRLRIVPKGLKPVEIAAPVAASKPVKPAEKAEPAKKPVAAFPESKFDLFNFKTYFVNQLDKEARMKHFWDNYDSQGWCLYHLKYIPYPGECEVVYRTSNLLNGFLSRTQHFAKNIFGVHGIFGDEPKLSIEAVWLIRGLDLLADIKEHDQFDTYQWVKLDHTKDSDRKIVEQMWSVKEEGTDKFFDQTLQVFKWVK